MNRLVIAVGLVLTVSCLTYGQAKPQAKTAPAGQNTVQEVSALEEAWMEAANKYEVSWFERHLADSIVSTDENGAMVDKAAMIADVKNRANKYESTSYENLKVHAYGDAAVATGIFVVKGTYKGKDNSGRFQWTDTWVKRGGQWQCVASHASKIISK